MALPRPWRRRRTSTGRDRRVAALDVEAGHTDALVACQRDEQAAVGARELLLEPLNVTFPGNVAGLDGLRAHRSDVLDRPDVSTILGTRGVDMQATRRSRRGRAAHRARGTARGLRTLPSGICHSYGTTSPLVFVAWASAPGASIP